MRTWVDTNLGDILTFLRGSWKRVAGGGEAAFGLRGMRGWVWWSVLGEGVVRRNRRGDSGEGGGGLWWQGSCRGMGICGRGRCAIKLCTILFFAVDGWVVGKWDGRGTGATEAAALGRRGALRNKALYNFIFPRTTTRQSGRGAPAQPVKKAAARDAQNGA